MSLLVIVYDNMAPYSGALRRRNSEASDQVAAAPGSETQPHFIGRFTQPVYGRISYNRSWDQAQPPVVETNHDFHGKYVPAVYARGSITSSIEGPAPLIQSETNTDFLGRFANVAYGRQHYQSEDDSPPPAIETNIDFHGRFIQSAYVRPAYVPSIEGPNAVIQPGTNIEFRGKFVQNVYGRLQYQTDDEAPPSAAETVADFHGRFSQPVYARSWYNAPSLDLGTAAAQPDTITDFRGRFSQLLYTRFQYNSYGQEKPPAVETNPHFIGRLAVTAYIRAKFNVESVDQTIAVIQPETGVNFRGNYSTGFYSRLQYTSDAPQTGTALVVIPPPQAIGSVVNQMGLFVFGPNTPQLNDLVQVVLDDLGVMESGQPVAAEDANTIILRLFPKLESLNERDVCYIDKDNISNAQFLPLSKIMAWELAPAFNITDQTKLAMLRELGGPNGIAEQELKDIVRLRTPRQTMRCEIFTGSNYRRYGRY